MWTQTTILLDWEKKRKENVYIYLFLYKEESPIFNRQYPIYRQGCFTNKKAVQRY